MNAVLGITSREAVTNAPPLLVVGHGSIDPAGSAAFNALTSRLAARLAAEAVDVAGGFIELSRPPLSAAVDHLTASGHRHLVAVPMMLASAGHAKGDIPAALARERARHPTLTFSYGRPLGPHPTLLAVLTERIAAVLGSARRLGNGSGPSAAPPAGGAVGDGGTAAVLLAGRGSTDPDANAETYKTARLLWETLPAALAARQSACGTAHGAAPQRAGPAARRPSGEQSEPVWHHDVQGQVAFAETAFVSLARPDIAEGLERCRLLGARTIVVARYFLFPGVLPDRVAEHAGRYAAEHPDLDIRCTDVLGECDEIAELATERYREALGGDIRMNCDMCMYRASLPGFQHKAGAPAHPHHHPADPVISDARHHAH